MVVSSMNWHFKLQLVEDQLTGSSDWNLPNLPILWVYLRTMQQRVCTI